MYTKPHVRPTFDARKHFDDAEDAHALTQVAFDSVNLTYLLIGDIPFGEYLEAPWSDIMGRILARIPDAGQFELADESLVSPGLSTLSTDFGDMSWIAYLSDTNSPGKRQAITEILLDLWRHGLYLPFLTENEEENKLIQKSAEGLLGDGVRDIKYSDIFKRGGVAEYWPVIRRAMLMGVIRTTTIQSYCCDNNVSPTKCTQTPASKKCTGTSPCGTIHDACGHAPEGE